MAVVVSWLPLSDAVRLSVSHRLLASAGDDALAAQLAISLPLFTRVCVRSKETAANRCICYMERTRSEKVLCVCTWRYAIPIIKATTDAESNQKRSKCGCQPGVLFTCNAGSYWHMGARNYKSPSATFGALLNLVSKYMFADGEVLKTAESRANNCLRVVTWLHSKRLLAVFAARADFWKFVCRRTRQRAQIVNLIVESRRPPAPVLADASAIVVSQ